MVCDAQICPICGNTLRLEVRDETFDLITSTGMLVVPVQMPYHVCDNDNWQQWGADGEEARTEARADALTNKG